MAKTILIVVHQYEKPLLESTFVIRYLTELWKQQGHIVRITRGTDKHIAADLVINHVDLTVTPQKYIHYFNRYTRKVNTDVTDISKSLIST